MEFAQETLSYNTERGHLHIPEYGRNVQNMIDYAKKIESREERNNAVKAIIEVMGQLNPHLRDVEDYKHKLWTHLFIMSDFDLDVDSPYPLPERETLLKKPEPVNYPKNKSKFGHFGHYTESIIKKVSKIEDEEEKKYLTDILGNLMKKNYLLFHTGNVENRAIAKYLEQLSDGKLKLDSPEELKSTKQILKDFGITPNTNNNRKKHPKSKKRKK